LKTLIAPALAVAAALLTAVPSVFGQTKTEEAIQTDTVDLFKQPEVQNKKSPGIAMAASIVLPGLGHQYLGMQNHAVPYFAAEALFVFGAIFCEQYSQRLTENSHLYALEYARAQGGPGANDSYWQNVGDFSDVQGYNQAQELNGTPQNKYTSANLSWTWLDDSYRTEYQNLRANGTDFHVASGFFIGAMVLDRVIAFVDARATTKFSKIRHAANLSVTPEFSDNFSTAGAKINCSF
jgi:hypothetical protein